MIYLKLIYCQNCFQIKFTNYCFLLILENDGHYFQINIFFYFFCFFSIFILFFHITIYFFLLFITAHQFLISINQLFARAVHFIFTTQFCRFCKPFPLNCKYLYVDFLSNLIDFDNFNNQILIHLCFYSSYTLVFYYNNHLLNLNCLKYNFCLNQLFQFSKMSRLKADFSAFMCSINCRN